MPPLTKNGHTKTNPMGVGQWLSSALVHFKKGYRTSGCMHGTDSLYFLLHGWQDKSKWVHPRTMVSFPGRHAHYSILHSTFLWTDWSIAYWQVLQALLTLVVRQLADNPGLFASVVSHQRDVEDVGHALRLQVAARTDHMGGGKPALPPCHMGHDVHCAQTQEAVNHSHSRQTAKNKEST